MGVVLNGQKALGDTSYASALRESFIAVSSASPPQLYADWWRLGIRGILTSNIDRFATRAFPIVHESDPLSEFKGIDFRYQADVLRGGSRFVVNLHGVLDEKASWVFTKEDLEKLFSTPGFLDLISACFLTCTVLFIGISADDQAAGGHLERLKARGLSLNGHFWLTHRSDQATHHWAEAAGLRQIIYQAPSGDHSELAEVIVDLSAYMPRELPAEPVLPSVRRVRHVALPSPEEVARLGAEEIREVLNKEAIRILDSGAPDKFDRYRRFLIEYSEAIYRSRWTSCVDGSNHFFEYTLKSPLAKGGFGQVFRASSETGADVAIKILHTEAMNEQGMLDGFRRGVRAMHILAQRHVPGIVPYVAQWEIPASVVMEFIDGPNLEEAVEARWLDSWEDILTVSRDLVRIIFSSHNVPEKVLHRDIRPANVMLRDNGNDGWEVQVLDFDLSWHREAIGFSVNTSGTLYGYMAPELTGFGNRLATRNALVDSFGLGMTLFFLVTGRHPKFGEQNHADWLPTLHEKIAKKESPGWRSLPRRIARLIQCSTYNKQSMRWDMTRIGGELDRLLECVKGRRISGAELWAEELAARCPELRADYIWDEARLSASIRLPTGFSVTVSADEMNELVRTQLEWTNPGETKYESVRKFVGPAADRAAAELKKVGLSIREKHVTFHTARVSAEAFVSRLQTSEALNNVSAALGNAIRAMQLKA